MSFHYTFQGAALKIYIAIIALENCSYLKYV